MTRMRRSGVEGEAAAAEARGVRREGVPSGRWPRRLWHSLVPGVLAAGAVAVFAAAGSLDSSFGTGGVVQIPLTQHGIPRAAVVQPDGKLVVGGRDDALLSVPWYWRIRRLLTDGTADTGFGTAGQVVLFGERVASDTLQDVALDGSGRILAVGSHVGLPTIVRLNGDGSLDATFGTGGVLSLVVPGAYHSSGSTYAVVVQPDGKLVVAGTVPLLVKSTTQDARFAARLDASGSLDTTFGVGGIRIHDLTKGDDRVASMALQSDGKIVLGGAFNGTTAYALSRLLANGSVDTGFGSRQTPFIGTGLAVDAGNRILVTGTVSSGATSCDAAVVRYGADGVLDASFGVDGMARVHDPLYLTYGNGGLEVRSDGRIVLGTTVRLPASQNLVRAVRLWGSGLLDLTFGTAGLGDPVVAYGATPFGGLALAPDGGCFLVGVLYPEAAPPYVGSWFVARYLGD